MKKEKSVWRTAKPTTNDDMPIRLTPPSVIELVKRYDQLHGFPLVQEAIRKEIDYRLKQPLKN